MNIKFTVFASLTALLVSANAARADLSESLDSLSNSELLVLEQFLELIADNGEGENSSQACSRSEAPTCGGECENGDVCRPIGARLGTVLSEPICRCMKPETAACGGYKVHAGPQGEKCEYGLCPAGEKCQATAGKMPGTVKCACEKEAPKPPSTPAGQTPATGQQAPAQPTTPAPGSSGGNTGGNTGGNGSGSTGSTGSTKPILPVSPDGVRTVKVILDIINEIF